MSSTQQKAEQTKEFFEGYYKNLTSNYLSNIFTFEARRKPEGKVRILEVNLPKGIISYRSGNSSKRAGIPLKDIHQVIKTKSNNKQVKVVWYSNSGGSDPKREKNAFYFHSMEKRECFCELAFLGQIGVKSLINEQPIEGGSPISPETLSPIRARSGSSPAPLSPSNNARGRSGTATAIPFNLDQIVSASITHETINVFVGTWNMGNAPAENIEDWLMPGGNFDIYAIGVQECQYTPRGEKSSCEEDWFSVLQTQLGSDYVKIAGVSLQSIRLSLYCRKEHVHKIQNVKKSTEATGIAHVYGNKGGVAISCEYYGTSLCFIAAHFAAHQENTATRNSNYYEIIEGVNLGKKQQDIINSFQHLIWFGDLNYRIDLFKEEVTPLLTYGNFERLLEADQLLKERTKQQVFVDWNEAPITFPPTYKYCIGSRVYTDERNRVPSWCDRVLWKSLPGADPLENTAYKCCDKVMTSDHSPVFATLKMRIPLPHVGSFVKTHSNSPNSSNSVPCKIILSELGVTNLQAVDSAVASHETTLEIRGYPVIENTVRTQGISKIPNPVWSDPVVLQPAVSSKGYLEYFHLWVDLCIDENSIGRCTVSLREAFGDTPASFISNVTKGGKVTGMISGKVHVIYSQK